jgi:hypothetical protein
MIYEANYYLLIDSSNINVNIINVIEAYKLICELNNDRLNDICTCKRKNDHTCKEIININMLNCIFRNE